MVNFNFFFFKLQAKFSTLKNTIVAELRIQTIILLGIYITPIGYFLMISYCVTGLTFPMLLVLKLYTKLHAHHSGMFQTCVYLV